MTIRNARFAQSTRLAVDAGRHPRANGAMRNTNWQVVWTPRDRRSAEHEATVFTCANGLFATRGTHPELDLGMPAATLAGIFTDDRLGFRTLVATLRWLDVTLECGRRRLDPYGDGITAYERVFDLRAGIIARRLTWTLPHGGSVRVETEHFCSLADPRVGWQRYTVHADEKAAQIRLTARTSARAITRGEILLGRFRSHADPDGIAVEARTPDDSYCVAHAARVMLSMPARVNRVMARGTTTWTASLRLEPGQSVTLWKVIGLASDRDAGESFAQVARDAVRDAAARGFDVDRRRHAGAWRRLWRDIDLSVEGDDEQALALRYVTAQRISHAPHDDRAGLAAKPLCAEGYRGHVFWDTDLFMTPAITALRPDLGRHLANYRWEMLPGARQNAQQWGYAGAWYPWESADDGTEVTARYWLHPDGRKMPITCWKYEIHSVCDVAYAAWDFYQATGDRDWLLSRGVEILLETARFWASRATYVARRRRYEIHDVCGPDEAHERTDNCAFINVLAAWNIERALETLKALQDERPAAHEELLKRLHVSRAELTKLRRVGRRMYVPRDRRTGWYRQFDGYDELTFIDPLSAEDRFEESPDAAETQTVKQADVIMLLYLLRGQHSREQILANWDYYLPRTAHGTSLSAGTHAAVAARLGLRKTALRYFRQSVNMDLLNWRGDSGRGLHGAAMGGALCAVLFGFGGLEFREDCLRVDPILPDGWTRLRVPFVYQGRKLELDVTPGGLALRFRARGEPILVENAGKRRRLTADGVFRGKLLPPAQQRRSV